MHKFHHGIQVFVTHCGFEFFKKTHFLISPMLFELIMTETNLALEDLTIIDLDVPLFDTLYSTD